MNKKIASTKKEALHTKRPPFSVVIPTYNGKHLLDKYLPSVIEQLDSNDELLVIDDASTDGTKNWFDTWILTQEHVQKHGISVKFLENTQNLRFAASVNKAVTQVKKPYILLLNNDVEPKNGLLSELWKYVQSNPDPASIFAVGCLEFEHSAKNSESVLGGKNQLWFERGMFIHSRARTLDSGETAWASGGSALFDVAKWEELGGFDKAYYPAYWEDIDLSMRASKKGWQVLFCETAQVDHRHETTNSTVFGQQKIDMMSWKNAYIFAWKHMTIAQWLQHLVWLPHHLVITGIRTQGLVPKAFLTALNSIS